MDSSYKYFIRLRNLFFIINILSILVFLSPDVFFDFWSDAVFLWLINLSIFVCVLPFKNYRNVLLPIFLFFIAFSFVIVGAKEIWHKYQLNNFFGNYKEGEIIFNSNENMFSGEINIKSFSLVDKKLKQYTEKRYKQELEKKQKFIKNIKENFSPNNQYSIGYDRNSFVYYVIDKKINKSIFKLKHWAISKFVFNWSPNSRFIVYDYAEDRDDLSKIFVADIKTGKTILLSAGSKPFWVK